jgi:hypothetical protein
VLCVTDSILACAFRNSKRGFDFPIYCILFDGSFSFFKFERQVVAAQNSDGATEDEHDETDTEEPVAKMQVKKHFYRGWLMQDELFELPARPVSDALASRFSTVLRQIAEITLYLLLSSYSPALEGQQNLDRKNKDSWKAGANAVHRVCEKCVEAASLDDTNAADVLSTSAMHDLASRYD